MATMATTNKWYPVAVAEDGDAYIAAPVPAADLTPTTPGRVVEYGRALPDNGVAAVAMLKFGEWEPIDDDALPAAQKVVDEALAT